MPVVDICCPIEKNDERVMLLSPSVGRIKFLIQNQQPIIGGQAIFELWRLNTCFLVYLPKELSGIFESINKELNFYAAFHSKIAVLNPLEAQQKKYISEEINKDGEAIISPMDGMFYLRSSPDQEPLVQVGQRIEPGQTIGLIEVMKCYYPLKFTGNAPAKIKSILINNSSPISLGSRIFLVDNLEKLEEMRGFMKGANPSNTRDRDDNK